MNRFHGEKSVWPIVKVQIKKAKKSQQIFAAIAYIGIDAPKIMPLRRGDVLVCNSSDEAIKQGSTSAKALNVFFERGVKIFNEPRLHGKVVVFPKRVFVGSANVSTRSRDVLYEAVVETTDPKIIGSSLSFVQRLAQEISKIDREDIKRLQGLPVANLSPQNLPPKVLQPLMKVPNQVPILKLIPICFEAYSQKVESKIRTTKKSIRSDFFDGGSRADIEGQEWGSDWWSILKPGMWYIGVAESGRLYQPKKVIKVSKVTSRTGIVWLAKPKQGKSFIQNRELLLKLDFNWDDDRAMVLKEEKTRALLKLFKED